MTVLRDTERFSSKSLIGNALALLLEHPAHLAAVREDPARLGHVIEETLRLDSPLLWLGRQTTTEVELGGVKVPARSEDWRPDRGCGGPPSVTPDGSGGPHGPAPLRASSAPSG
ncbi:hypothetical protein [Sorangium sp. So ce1097]|uniref:hypothetical protein n=1 Tax=Sorangium sp. So ce1097 TaxID=3133330 RepID=UPI003F5DF074